MTFFYKRIFFVLVLLILGCLGPNETQPPEGATPPPTGTTPPPTGPVKPGVPQDLSADGSYYSIDIRWTAVDNASEYHIFRSPSSEGAYTEIGTSVSASFTNNNLIPGTDYFYKVSAVNSAGDSELSAALSAQTLEATELAIQSVTYLPNPLPSSYSPNDGTSITISVEGINNGSALSNTNIIAELMVSDRPYAQGPANTSSVHVMGLALYLAYGACFTVSPLMGIDISTSGFTGDNYFFIHLYAVDATYNVITDDINTADNYYAINAAPVTMTALIHASWISQTLNGGANIAGATEIDGTTGLEAWYDSELTESETAYYKVINLDEGTSYDIYIDDPRETSSSKTCNLWMTVMDEELTMFPPLAESSDPYSYYISPMQATVPAGDSYVILMVKPLYPGDSGTFSFGIMKTP